MSDSTLRFTGRAESYQQFRPSYPEEILPLLAAECPVSAGAAAADIGAGTGILSEMLLRWGYRVTAVEPNAEMRAIADTCLSGWPQYSSTPGTAEQTLLPSASLDLVTAAQAFHWFDPPAARREFRRVLKPGGLIFLIWNERRDDTPFLEAFEHLLQTFGTDYNASRHRKIPEADVNRFFGPEGCRLARFANQQPLDREGLLGRVLSCSYAPLPEAPGHTAMRQALMDLFDRFQSDGQVSLLYETRVYYGRLSGPV